MKFSNATLANFSLFSNGAKPKFDWGWEIRNETFARWALIQMLEDIRLSSI
jgi:hypothetical protein